MKANCDFAEPKVLSLGALTPNLFGSVKRNTSTESLSVSYSVYSGSLSSQKQDT